MEVEMRHCVVCTEIDSSSGDPNKEAVLCLVLLEDNGYVDMPICKECLLQGVAAIEEKELEAIKAC